MRDKLLGMVIAVGYTFISTIVAVLIIINVLVGIIGGIWLAVRGEWGLIAWGVALAFIIPWAWMLVNLPSMGLFFLVNRFMDKGNRVFVAIFGFLSSVYTYMLIVLWVFYAFGFFMRHASSEMYVPYLLWGYSSIMAPLAYMAKKEGQESAGTSGGLFCAQLSFVIITLFWFFGVIGIALFVTFSFIVLAFSLFAVFLVVSSMSDHYEDRNYVLRNQPVIAETIEEMVLASTGQRIGNLFLDMLFVSVFAFLFEIILGLIGLGDGIEGMNDRLPVLIILLIYYVPQEAFSGRTLGKLITGTKAVNEDGTNLTFGKALGRTLCRFIPFEPFSFFGGQGRPKGWHDRIPKTKVISTRKI
jgi:uncharacterized RDD family membrane protein YckC